MNKRGDIVEEEKNVEPQVEVVNETKKFDFKSFNFKSFDYKKYLPWAGIALAVIVVIIILAAALGGGPKKAVKNFISGMNSRNASKIVKNIDIAGMSTWGYSYNVNKFSKEDYKEFVEEYKDAVKEMEKEDLKEAEEYMEETMKDSFDEIKDEYKSYKFKIEKFKDVEKLGKDLYAVDAKVSVKAKPKDKDVTDEIDESDTVTFVIYKNKLISFGEIGL